MHLEAILVAMLCGLGIQNEDLSAACGLPCKSRIREVKGYQKTLSVFSRLDRTTMPFSDTSSSVPACLWPAGPKYTIASWPTQASGICSAIAPLPRPRPPPHGQHTLTGGL